MNIIPPNLQSAILHHFIEQVESGDLDAISGLTDIGFTPQQIDKLRHLQVTEIVRLIKEGKPLIRAWGDSANLDKALKALSTDRAASALQVEFIRRGASAAMMIPLFHLTAHQVAKLRVTLGVKPAHGRPKLPDEETASRADEILTQALRKALALVDVRALDHFIISGNGIMPFAERGFL